MPVVVSDTSPIRALEFVTCLDVLPVLFNRVLVPPAVVTELARSGGRYRNINVSRYPFLEVLAPADQDQVKTLLHCGLKQAIRLPYHDCQASST